MDSVEAGVGPLEIAAAFGRRNIGTAHRDGRDAILLGQGGLLDHAVDRQAGLGEGFAQALGLGGGRGPEAVQSRDLALFDAVEARG